MYRKLDIEETLKTIERLRLRIEDRFPGSGLSKVCGELYDIGLTTKNNIHFVSRPIWWLRGLFAFVLALFVSTLLLTVNTIEIKQVEGFINAMSAEGLEAVLQIMVFFSASVFFFVQAEDRIKRSRVLKYLYELRTIAHVIDMHQLTKDPKAINSYNTANSPKRELNDFELLRYLDYCCEMLSLTSKLSALYANDFHDDVVLNTINEIEDLTLGLNNKIWQKIMLVDQGAGK
jgi:hypothetical protein